MLGLLGLVGGALILSYYSVIAGWTLHYVLMAAGDVLPVPMRRRSRHLFGGLLASPAVQTGWHSLFMLMTIVVVGRGVERGLESAVRIMVPALVAIMLGLLVYAMNSGAFMDGVNFLFAPDFDRLTGRGMLAAMGQAFFSLSVGMGAVMAYGAYLPREESIITTSVAVVVADTGIAMLAGLVIFPIVFANGLDPAEGPGLVFQTLPLAFGQMPGGLIVGVLFFLLLAFAALTSAISLLEAPVAWLVESRAMRRGPAAALAGGVIWLLGLLTVLSFNLGSDFIFLARHLVRQHRLSDLEHPAAAGRIVHHAIRRLGHVRQFQLRRTGSVEPARFTPVAVADALCRAGRRGGGIPECHRGFRLTPCTRFSAARSCRTRRADVRAGGGRRTLPGVSALVCVWRTALARRQGAERQSRPGPGSVERAVYHAQPAGCAACHDAQAGGRTVQELDGDWRFEALGEQGCRISLRMRFAFSNPVKDRLLGPVFEKTCNTLVDAFVTRAAVSLWLSAWKSRSPAGLPDRQRIIRWICSPGTTAGEAVAQSGIAAEFPQLDLADCPLAIFGQPVESDAGAERRRSRRDLPAFAGRSARGSPPAGAAGAARWACRRRAGGG